jgi:hypothetical protein
MIATPATFKASVVASAMVSAWPGLTMMMSPRFAVHCVSA